MAELPILDVRLYGNPIGTLTLLPGDRVLFAFNEQYIANPERPTLSLSYKDAFGELLTEFRPVQTRLPTFFSNLLPEGAMRDYLAEKAHVKPTREFFLAWVLGQDLPGALEIKPTKGEPLLPIDDEPETERSEDTSDQIMRFSLAGVQLKFSAIKEASGGLTIPTNGTGGSWIVKLPSIRFPGVPENEFAMMEMARRMEIDVPATKLLATKDIHGLPDGIESAGPTAFAIQRFDRGPKNNLIHIEDFAQVFGVYPENKYKRASYRNIAEVIWIETGEAGISEFLRRFVFNALIGNADMHLKNWSFIYPDRRKAKLAPAYDFVSTIPYLKDDKLALNFVDSRRFESLDFEQFERFAAKAKLPEKLTHDIVLESVERFRDVWGKSQDLPIEAGVRASIDKHLKTVPLWTDAPKSRARAV